MFDSGFPANLKSAGFTLCKCGGIVFCIVIVLYLKNGLERRNLLKLYQVGRLLGE